MAVYCIRIGIGTDTIESVWSTYHVLVLVGIWPVHVHCMLVYCAAVGRTIPSQHARSGMMKEHSITANSYIKVTRYTQELGSTDPLHHYLSEYIDMMVVDTPELFKNVATIFSFLQATIEEFTNANPKYRKPPGFTLTYSKPSCCPETIVVSYLNQLITITSIN
jgi:hypothetical protein